MSLLHSTDEELRLTVDTVEQMFNVVYSPVGSNRRMHEETVYMNYHFFLESVEGK
jgi:hypothetical protein